MRKVPFLCGSLLVLVGAGGAFGAFTGFENFDSYNSQAEFEAAYPVYYDDLSSMQLIQGSGLEVSSPNMIAGVIGGSTSYHQRNYAYMNDFNYYKPTAADPMEFSFKANILGDQNGADNVGARNFIEIQGFDEGTFVIPPPLPNGVAPNVGVRTGLRLIALGTYNTPNTVTGNQWYGRVIAPGASAWFEIPGTRTVGAWTELKALVYTGPNAADNKVEILVDGVVQKTVQLTGVMKPMTVISLGSGLSSAGVDVAFDDIKVTPEPATLLMLAAGGLLLRRRRA